LLGQHFSYIEKLREEDGLEFWQDIAIAFNTKFNESLSPEVLRNRFRRERAARDTLVGDVVDKAFRIIKREPIKPTELARRLNLDINGLEDVLDELMSMQSAIKFQQNYLIFDSSFFPDNFTLALPSNGAEIIKEKWGIFADSHYCSIYENISLIHEFYKICEQEKVKGILCAGDLTAGNGQVFKGQMQELKIIGNDKQIEYVRSIWPDTNLMTYAISGNHDLSAFKSSGTDIVACIAEKVENLTYLGKIAATLNTEGVNIRLHHGDGGLGSIRSLKAQKYIDSMEEPLPDVFVLGHYHISDHIPKYRGVISIMPGCFESKSEYLEKKGLVPDIGGVILDVTLAVVKGKKKVIRHTFEFIDMS
jgi:predicted phosphodiesterase/predicted transcriptional regulator